MKITIATGPIFPVPAIRGGAVQRLWEGLAREFAKRGHEVTIFARKFPGQASEEAVDGIRYVRRGGYAQSTSIKRDLVKCLLYALKTARHVPPGDVVVTNDFWMPAVLPWMKPSAGNVVACLQRFPKNQGFLYGKCVALAAVSQAVADAVKVQSPSVASKVVVVPNAIDEVFLEQTVERGAGSREKEADGIRLTAEGRRPVRILYVGRIHPEKGLGLLANALRVLAARDRKTNRSNNEEPESAAADGDSVSPVGAGRGQTKEWECVLVGPVAESQGGGGEAFTERLKKQVSGLPVRFEAPVYSPEVLAEVYDQADLFVYPSVAESGESFGIAPLEAMARGVAPVVSDLAVFRDYLQPGINGMVFDHRAADAGKKLAETIAVLLSDPGRRKQIGLQARKMAERFSLREVANRYLSLFESCVRS